MFICNPCLKKNYENIPSFSSSFGRCEVCGYACICNDIPSKNLIGKKPMDSKGIHRNSNFIFVEKVLRSCETSEELSMAEKMIWQYARIVLFEDFKSTEDLQEIYRKLKSDIESRQLLNKSGRRKIRTRINESQSDID